MTAPAVGSMYKTRAWNLAGRRQRRKCKTVLGSLISSVLSDLVTTVQGLSWVEDRLELRHLRELQQAEISCCDLLRPPRGSSTLAYCAAFPPLGRISQPWLPACVLVQNLPFGSLTRCSHCPEMCLRQLQPLLVLQDLNHQIDPGKKHNLLVAHYPDSSWQWAHSHALATSVVSVPSLPNRKRRTPPSLRSAGSVLLKPQCKNCSCMLVQKVDQVKRWVKLRIWPVSSDDIPSV